jgi:hypothetical protein
MITPKDLQLLNEIAVRLGVAYSDLFSLINFESGFNPQAKNPKSSARGLIQFMDATAKSLGYADSLDLVTKNPTIEMQLPIVEKYLQQFAPYTGKQSLYLAVFYPKYRNVDPLTQFPDSVKSVNPGINTPQDYINFIERKKKLNI